jgi:hypothetical protein
LTSIREVSLNRANDGQHVSIGRFTTLAVVATLLVTFVCSTVNAQSARVSLESGYTQAINAIRDNQKTSVQIRFIRVRVANHAGKTRQFDVRMFYDPQTKLFLWGYFEMYQDYSSEWAAKQFTPFAGVYITADKLRVFNNTGFGYDLTIMESSERHDSIGQAQNTVVHFFEKEPIPSSKWEFKHVDYLMERPRDFFKQCFSAFNTPPTVEDVQRQGNQWRVTVKVQQNGNAAEITLDDSYNLISTKFIGNPAAASAGRCN